MARADMAPVVFMADLVRQCIIPAPSIITAASGDAADAGSAKLLGTPMSMIAALQRLGNLQPGVLPDSLKAMGIAEGKKTSLWSTHPSLDDRIAALRNWTAS